MSRMHGDHQGSASYGAVPGFNSCSAGCALAFYMPGAFTSMLYLVPEGAGLWYFCEIIG